MVTSHQSAKQIKELRYRLGMTQEQFAVKLGVTHGTINRWENGKSHPSPLALEKITQLSSR
jgi:putative transcriptional regulator